MPELPEVETVAADLRPQLIGACLADAHILWSRTLAEPDPQTLRERVAGCRVIDIGRRGKYLMIFLDSTETLIIHLRMTGRLDVVLDGDPLLSGVHLRAWFEMADGRRLTFTDARKFGRIWLVKDSEMVVGKLGPEPLGWDFTPETLSEQLHGRRAAIKAVLLDQSVVAGVGNIYADESLFLSGIHPLCPAADLTPEDAIRLHRAIRQVLTESINERGTMLRDYRTPYGQDGAYQNRFRVYQQTGHPCPRCGAPIVRIRVTQRGTHFCPRCQPS